MTAELTDHKEPTRKRILIDALYRRYGAALRDFLNRRRLSQDDVADIVQETFSRVLKTNDVESIHNPRAFLFKIATNVRLNEHKHRQYAIEEDMGEADALDIPSDDPDPCRRLQGEQELEILRAALEELPAPCRDAFVMNRFENKTFRQIAAEMKLSVSMIEKHVSHAIAHMRAHLNEASPPRKGHT